MKTANYPVQITHLEWLRLRQKSSWCQMAEQMLTDAGVPELVCLRDVPAGSLPERLKWYLNRRKDVQEFELTTDEKNGWKGLLANLDKYENQTA